jgi:hypothetical protein
LCSSAYAVVLVVERSQSINTDNFFERNEVNFVFAGLQSLCPTLFNVVSILEENHPRIALRWQLARILVLNILNFVCLLLSTFQKVESQVSLVGLFAAIIQRSNLIVVRPTFLRCNRKIDRQTQTKQLKEIKDNLTLLHRFELQENLTHLSDLTTEALDVQSATFVSVIRERRQEGEGRMFPPEKGN